LLFKTGVEHDISNVFISEYGITATVLCMRASMINASAANQKYLLVSTFTVAENYLFLPILTTYRWDKDYL
jgi:hypothetical protein